MATFSLLVTLTYKGGSGYIATILVGTYSSFANAQKAAAEMVDVEALPMGVVRSIAVIQTA
jgi:predicted butyrate kinase (DUF1464 family)